ncbi:tRNA (adenine(37)-N6)-methyltransferase [Hypomesus transpacificus]|uniref:tRNA (adenine(37)-N6)-methyltransferase n=1 Tax=Hypomesus transpacificus TaxID=137520 RepID=UPI001F0754CE|nr:tRNA (adenine(37)-N6)-methyltransferase [Hypomesus transpacificus]XP_046901395.1 tRNA (adenine(37)-N6)-methyltransferase [Hypomesus transpacificus]
MLSVSTSKMSHTCCYCREHLNKLNEQVSVMRKEINNLRQGLDSAVRAHRKHMVSLRSALSDVGQVGFQTREPTSRKVEPTHLALERGTIQTVPIGYISSCFSLKSGTPRQPTLCGASRATLQVQQSLFSNPEHSLVGLEQFSHVWVIFLFHKNGQLSCKAKVKPPRLNGQRVGVYSTRSPHRPNALGLSLARLDRVCGDILHLSEIDMIDGTPVLDIKPYIPDYDSPHSRTYPDEALGVSSDQATDAVTVTTETGSVTSSMVAGSGCPSSVVCELDSDWRGSGPNPDPRKLLSKDESKGHTLSGNYPSNFSAASSERALSASHPSILSAVLEDLKAYVTQGDAALSLGSSIGKSQASDRPTAKPVEAMEDGGEPCYGEEAYSTIAGWIREPPVASLEVRFTAHTEKELAHFLPPEIAGLNTEPQRCGRPRFRFLRGPEEAREAIRSILSADPRSVYRRTRCEDRLFFFTLDTAHVTCWFGPGFAEVLRVRPVGPLHRTGPE